MILPIHRKYLVYTSSRMNTLYKELLQHILDSLDKRELWLLSHTCQFFKDVSKGCKINDIALYSAECGNIEMLEYAIILHKYKPTLAISATAAEKGHVSYIKYLLHKQYPTNNITRIYAAKGKQYDVLELLQVDTGHGQFFETVFCTNDIKFVEHVLSEYGCKYEFNTLKCTDVHVLKILHKKNMLANSFFETVNSIDNITKSKRLDTLEWLFSNMSQSLYESIISRMLVVAINTCDISYVKSILDSKIIFSTDTPTYKDKLVRHNRMFVKSYVSYMRMVATRNGAVQALPMLEWLIQILGFYDYSAAWTNVEDFDIYMYLVKKGASEGSMHGVRNNAIQHCLSTKNTKAIQYFMEFHKEQLANAGIYAALEMGDTDFIEWAFENDIKIPTTFIGELYMRAISSRKTNVVKVLHNKLDSLNIDTDLSREDTESVIKTAYSVSLDMLKCIQSVFNYAFAYSSQHFIESSIAHCNIDVIKWLCNNGFPIGATRESPCSHHIIKYDDVDVLRELRKVGFRYSETFLKDAKSMFASKCYIYAMEEEFNEKISSSHNCYINIPASYTFVPTIEELDNNYVCCHYHCKSQCGSVRCLYKGMSEIKQYDEDH